ncbi:chorismate--pyruvate lyase family protein [Halomonas sp. E19]|uniref:chorismate--pyruvate lyase family protein n=1 Tax=Halomonas sp. E19 TaxID=3397247 RepID=UPI004033E4C7
MSPGWWQWVASRDSLTARLIAAGAERRFRVRLLDQRLDRPRPDEAQALGLPCDRLAWRREVALCLDERPWVVARSVASLALLRGQRLDRLGERSLGSWLFRQPDLERSPIEITRASAPSMRWTAPGAGVRCSATAALQCWCRSSSSTRWRRNSAFPHARINVIA